jgi:hypothetical protein
LTIERVCDIISSIKLLDKTFGGVAMSSLYRVSFVEKRHPRYNALFYFLKIYLRGARTFFVFFLDVCEKDKEVVLQELKTFSINDIPDWKPSVVIHINNKNNKRILEFYKITSDCYLVDAYDADDEKECLSVIWTEEDKKWKFSFPKKAVQDIITEDEVAWHVRMCKLSEEKRKEEPDKKWQVREIVFIDEEHKEKFKEV